MPKPILYYAERVLAYFTLQYSRLHIAFKMNLEFFVSFDRGIVIHYKYRSFFRRLVENELSERIFDILLNSPLQWSCPKLRIISFVGDKLFCIRGQFNREFHLFQSLIQIIERDIDDLENMFFIQRVEYDDIIDPVEKFR